MMEEAMYNSDGTLYNHGRDIPGETAQDDHMTRGLPANIMSRLDDNNGSLGLSQLHFQNGGFPANQNFEQSADLLDQRSHYTSSSAAREILVTDLVQNSAASPALPRSRNNSLQALRNENDPILFTPIKMLNFNELEDTDKHGKLTAASLSKCSTPNARFSSKKSNPAMARSPEKAVVLSVDEINASPIWHHSYSDQAVDRELEQRLALAGHLGDESPSDRGSRERSPIIDGAEYEDTIQNRFQSMQIRNSRRDNIQASGVLKQPPPQGRSEFNPRVNAQTGAQPVSLPGRQTTHNFSNGPFDNNNFTRPTQLQGKAQSDIETRLGFQLTASHFPGQSVHSDIVTNSQQNHPVFKAPQQSVGNSQHPGHVFANHADRQLPHCRLFQFDHPALTSQNPATFTNQLGMPDQLQFSKLQPDDPANAYYYTPAVHTGLGSMMMPNVSASEAPVSDLPDPQDMDKVWGHLQSVIKEGEALLGDDEDNLSDGVSDLLAGQGQGTLQKLTLDHSPDSQAGSLWMGTRGTGMTGDTRLTNTVVDPSHRIWGDNSSSRYQSDPTLVAENRVLKETLEKERYRRKHCENHIQQLNAKLLETQQQLAVVMSQDKKKDTMIEQLDKQFARVVEGWKRKEAEKEDFVKQMKIEKVKSDESLHKQHAMLSQFEKELADTVEELRRERETSSLALEKFQTQIEDQEREMANLTEVMESEKDRAELMTTEWERAKESRAQAESKVEDLQDTLHKEQDNWYRREHELLQKLDELTETNLRAIQDEKRRTDEKGHLLEDVEGQLKLIMSEMGKMEIELDAAHREKESLKVEMSLNESKFENCQRKLEADLKADMEKQISEKLAEAHRNREESEQTLSEKHRKNVQELNGRHKEDLEHQLEQFHEELKQKGDEHRRKILEYEDQLNECRVENNALKNKKHKLEVQRTEVLSKLQLLMQSQWNEAVSLLGAASPGRQQGNGTKKASSHSTVSTSSSQLSRPTGHNSSILSGLNLSILSQPPVHSTTNNTTMENAAASTLNRENVVNLLNGSFLSQHQSHPSQHAPGSLPWQPSLQQQQQSSVLHNGPSSLPAALADLLNLSSWSGVPGYNQSENGIAAMKPPYSEGGTSSLSTQEYSLHGPAEPQHSDQWSRQPQNSSHVPVTSGGQSRINPGHDKRDETFGHHQGHIGQGEAMPAHSYPGQHQGNIGANAQGWKRMQIPQGARMGPGQLPQETINFLDTTRPSQQDPSGHRNVSFQSLDESSSRAVPIRPPQQRTHQTGHVTNGESRSQTERHGSHLRSKSHSLRRESPDIQVHSPDSEDFVRRMPDFSDDCSSITDGNSENGDFAKPRRLDFSPPTKQPRSLGGSVNPDHNSSAGTVEDGANNSVQDETMRLNEEYSHISDKLERHESRQTELQHYIQMLLQRSPGSPLEDGEHDSQYFEEELRASSSSTTEVQQKLQTLRTHAYQRGFSDTTVAAPRAPSANQTKGQPKHAVAKQPLQERQGHRGSLQEDQLQEISRLLDLYGTQSGAGDSPQSPRAMEILNLLQCMQASRRVPSNNRSANKTKQAGLSRMGPPARKPVEKNKKITQRSQIENGRDMNKSDSTDKGIPVKSAPPNMPKKMERKISAGSAQNKNGFPKWK